MKAPFASLPAAPAAAGMIAGILLAQQGLWIVGAIAGFGGFIALYIWHRHYASFFALMMAIGAMLTFAHIPEPVSSTYLTGKHQFQGKIISSQESDYGLQFIIDIQEIDNERPTPFLASVNSYQHDFMPPIGSEIRFKGKISAIPSEPVIPYDSYHPEWLKRQGVNYIIASTYGSMEYIKAPGSWDRMVNKLRDSMWNAIATMPVDGKCASFLLAAILGDRSFLLPANKDAFRATGTAHILALSGLHVGIIASMIGWLFLPLGWHRRGFYLSLPLIMLLIWIYAIITGLSASVVRAAVMLTLMMLCTLLQRKPQPFNAMCLAAVLILAFAPFQLFTPGFQLTFSAVITLLIFSRLVPSKLQRRPIIYKLVMAFVIPISAMLGTGLISAYYFHVFPLGFLIANIAVGIFIGPVLALGFVLMLLVLVGSFPQWLGAIEDWLYWAMEQSIRLVNQFGATVDTGYFSPWAFLPYGAMIAMAGLAVYRFKKEQPCWQPAVMAILALFVTAFAIGCCKIDDAPRSELMITNGSATAIVIRTDQQAFSIPLSEADDCTEQAQQRLKAYLSIRCQKSELQEMPRQKQLGPFYLQGNCLVMGNMLMCIFNEELTNESCVIGKADYAVIGPKYHGHVSSIIKACNPDCIILAGSISPSRARRLQRESPDSIKIINLLSDPSFLLTFP